MNKALFTGYRNEAQRLYTNPLSGPTLECGESAI